MSKQYDKDKSTVVSYHALRDPFMRRIPWNLIILKASLIYFFCKAKDKPVGVEKEAEAVHVNIKYIIAGLIPFEEIHSLIA